LPLLVLVLVSDVSGTTLTGLSPDLEEATRRQVLGDVDFELMLAGCMRCWDIEFECLEDQRQADALNNELVCLDSEGVESRTGWWIAPADETVLLGRVHVRRHSPRSR
jgi:hypothetical protein